MNSARSRLTVFGRAFVWAGGGLFVASLAYAAWWYAVVLARSIPFNGTAPLVADTALFTIFALHHSLLARPRMKAALSPIVPATLVRSIYVWTASMLLLLVCVLWRPVGGTL